MADETIRLFHFTAPYRDGHLGKILRDGRIDTTESNVSRTRANAGPPVVWLTNVADQEKHRGWASWSGNQTPEQAVLIKLLGRITVELPAQDVMRWTSFCIRHRVKPSLQAELASVGGSESWFVCHRPISRVEWISVDRMAPDGSWEPVASADMLPSLEELADERGVPLRIVEGCP